MRQASRNHQVLAGFDFPIGLPTAYAQRTGFPHFRAFLQALSCGQWPHWLLPGQIVQDISVYRPFYPQATAEKGSQHRAQLTNALNLTWDQLHRRCDRAAGMGNAAAVMFWTLGGNQVGKAMIAGLKEIILPLQGESHLWPFDGDLHDSTARLTLAETYPTRFYDLLGLTPRQKPGKTDPQKLMALAPALLDKAQALSITLSPPIEHMVRTGFAGHKAKANDDAFDALVGAIGMIATHDGHRPEHPPLTADEQAWEGWMLGAHLP
ncbi:hypothetical protein [Paracoccus sp. (in: a-proteobacteria)]|uniref:hypothetical protein n=1 Tax=Paracoccus sp. TaxID=267 RepID=UPI0034CE465C